MFRFLNKFWEFICHYHYEVEKQDRELFYVIREDILRQGFIRVDWDNLEQKYKVQFYDHYSQEKIKRIFKQAFHSAFVDYAM